MSGSSRSFALILTHLLLLVISSTFLCAADRALPSDVPHFSMDPKAFYAAASQSTPPEGTDVAVLEDEDDFVFDAEGGSVHTAYLVYKVLTKKGVAEWGGVGTSWQPWRGARPTMKARVITPDFAAHELDPKTISDAPAREDQSSVYSDRRVTRAPLPAMAPGSVVEHELISQQSVPFPGAGVAMWIPLGQISVPVEHCRIVLDAPSSLPLHYLLQLLPDLKPQRSEAGGRVRLVFDYGPIAAMDELERFVPPDVLLRPSLTFSTAASWKQVTDGYAALVESHLSVEEVKTLAAGLVQGKTSRHDKAEAILQYVDKEVRYTGVEFAEASITPHFPAETLAHKYGDCKDKAVLLVAMLRAAQIPAYLALTNLSWRTNVPADLPEADLFDHAIVYVPGDPDLWIDPTDEYARLGQLPLRDQGRLALVVRPESDALLRTPETSSRDNVRVELREMDLAENGPARIVETTQPRGYFESGYRRSFADLQSQQTRENLTNYVKAQYRAEGLDRWDRSDPADITKPFELVLESGKARRGYTELGGAGGAIRLDALFSELPEELQKREDVEESKAAAAKPKKKRVNDYQLPAPFVTEWQYKVVPPLGFQPKGLPPDVKLSLGPAMLSEQFSADGQGTVHAVIRFDTVKPRLTVAEATEMRNKIADLRDGEAILINFEPVGQALLKQGKAREAFKSYHAVIAQHPKEAVHHLQMARVLLEGGMGEAARREARLAVQLEPNSALAEDTMGDILEYDLVGRRFRAGTDYAGAAAAYRAASKLDPDDKSIVVDLAILLEYNPYGERYGGGAQLKDAVALLRALPQETLVNFGAQSNLAYDLFYSGEFAEARQYAEKLNPQPNALIVACEAVLNGSATAIAEANKRFSKETDQRQTLRAAGNMLLELRKYPLVADVWQAGAGGDNAAKTMTMASFYRQTKLHEDMQFGNNPKDIVLKYALLLLDTNATSDKLNSVLSRNARTVLQQTGPEAIETILKAAKHVRSGCILDEHYWDVEIDYRMQESDPKEEGSDAVGYSEKLKMPLTRRQTTVFVVKEDGQYKVLGTSEHPGAVGLEILDRVAANDLEGARALLDWMRETQHLGGGDDPLAGLAFPHFWTKGDKADANRMKLAAAAILVQEKETAQKGLFVLEEARNSGQSGEERTNIDHALTEGYIRLEGWEKDLPVASELSDHYPGSGQAFIGQAFALRGLGRFGEVQALVRERLKRISDDRYALEMLMRNASAQYDYRAAYQVGRSIVDGGKADNHTFNSLAWYSLFFDRPEGPDVESALKSLQLASDASSTLHTLACVYAAAGKPKEAYEVLVKAMDVVVMDEPDADYWYAFGSIAEQYGERDVALADYARVTKPKTPSEIPDSTYYLAQTRLKILQSDPPPGRK
jgi:transglutaminase-like putative cysteine protease/tetratricopeptide (TPR) repeat protein